MARARRLRRELPTHLAFSQARKGLLVAKEATFPQQQLSPVLRQRSPAFDLSEPGATATTETENERTANDEARPREDVEQSRAIFP